MSATELPLNLAMLKNQSDGKVLLEIECWFAELKKNGYK